MKETLLKKIEELGGMNCNYNILVSVDDFFSGNHVDGSFSANACDIDFDVNEFYSIFKQISQLDIVQGIWIMITDIDKEWAYSDTAFIAIDRSVDNNIVNNWFGKGFPSEIREVDIKNEKSIQAPELLNNHKLLCIWWD